MANESNLKLQRTTRGVIPNNSSKNSKGVCPIPTLFYKQADLDAGTLKSRVDKAFDILFEATRLSILAKTGDKKL